MPSPPFSAIFLSRTSSFRGCKQHSFCPTPRFMPSVEGCLTVSVLVEVLSSSWCGGPLPVHCTAWLADSFFSLLRVFFWVWERVALSRQRPVSWLSGSSLRSAPQQMGLINAGTAIGSLLAPPIIGFVLLHSGWRAVFLVAAAGGFGWVLWSALAYRDGPRFPSMLWNAGREPKT